METTSVIGKSGGESDIDWMCSETEWIVSSKLINKYNVIMKKMSQCFQRMKFPSAASF